MKQEDWERLLESLRPPLLADTAKLNELLIPPIVSPLPGDGCGIFRVESDASLRERIKQALGNTRAATGVSTGMEDNQSTPPADAPKSSLLAQQPAKLQDPPVTKGRIVLFKQHDGAEPHVALVVKVWANEGVNLVIFDENGHSYNRTSVCKGPGVGEWQYPARVS